MSEIKKNMGKLDKIVELSLLYDFYGELLKEHQKQIFEDYVLNDYSLSEIAEEAGISRQGVYDIVRRCIKQLEDYENKLHLIKKFQSLKDKIVKVKQTALEVKTTNEMAKLDEIAELSDEIWNDL